MCFSKINRASIRQGHGTPLLLPIVTRPMLQETPSMTIITNPIRKGKPKIQVATPLLFAWPLVVSINVSKNKMIMRQTLTRFGEGILLKLQGTLEDRWDLFQMVDQSPG